MAEVQAGRNAFFHFGDKVWVALDQSTGDEHGLGIKEIEEVGDAFGKVADQDFISAKCGGVASAGEASNFKGQGVVGHSGNVATGARFVLANQGGGGHIRFHATEAAAVAVAAIDAEHMVADAPGKAVIALQKPPV